MKKIPGVRHLIFVPGGFIKVDELKEIAKQGVGCLIILVTKAAGRGEHAHNLDVYAFDKKFVSPDELDGFKQNFGEEEVVTLEGVRSKVEERLTLEELIFIDPHELLNGEIFQNQSTNRVLV